MGDMRVAINGFGRIGRAFFKLAEQHDDLEVVAINDLGEKENFAYLLKYDSVYGTFESKDFDKVEWIQEKDPAKLPWGTLNIDIVVESTGLFTDYEKAKAHLDAGAKRVVISAPAKGDASLGATILMGLNEDKLKACAISSNASCTTNAASPLIAILDEAIGIEKALLNTTHAYTATQALVDGPSKKGPREGRAAALNIIPSSTGAAVAVTKAYESLAGKFDGISLRVPVPAGSIADITFIAKRDTTAEEVNDILRAAAKEKRWQGIFQASDEELVSSDIVGNTHAAIAQLDMTRVVGGNLVKVLSWYDNEMGYAHTLVEHVREAGKSL
ncbi:MAG TPA: glyceraldehyde 3-phosphate dehydrogenase NAD-binding domain-containing protein [Candidatus Paceibacterota bacterium]|nr:glyceraldehyde 3-phosphate dehydrogenase NAD-binding domain-containing protein [Candidatus Paceibacterota bacterium]